MSELLMKKGSEGEGARGRWGKREGGGESGREGRRVGGREGGSGGGSLRV